MCVPTHLQAFSILSNYVPGTAQGLASYNKGNVQNQLKKMKIKKKDLILLKPEISKSVGSDSFVKFFPGYFNEN